MTTAKQVLYSPVDIDDAEFVDFERDPKMEEESAEFETFKSEMHDAQFDAKITVGKKLTDSRGRPLGRQIFECFECGVDDYTFSQLCTRIREDFGTGLYQIHGRDSKGKYKFKKTVGILAPNQTDNVPAGNDVGQLIDKFSDAMERQAMRTEQMFSKLVGPQTGGDAIDQIVKIAGAIAPVLGALGIQRTPAVAPKTLVEQLTEFKMIKELFGGADDSGDSGDANIYSLLGKTVEAFGGPIAQAIAAGTESGELSETGLAALPAPELSRAEAMTEQEKHKMAMRKNIHILIQNAKTGIPPESFALILVNNTPEEKADELWDFISAPNCVKIILEIEPAAEPYKQWFEDLRKEVISLMADDPGDGDTDLQPGDDAPSISESETVAGDEDKESESSGKSDGDTSSDT
jgi:hypothetical protein